MLPKRRPIAIVALAWIAGACAAGPALTASSTSSVAAVASPTVDAPGAPTQSPPPSATAAPSGPASTFAPPPPDGCVPAADLATTTIFVDAPASIGKLDLDMQVTAIQDRFGAGTSA